jgi:NAD(P)H dehydrogenase (quinone)
MARVYVVFYSMYGHIHQLAQAEAAGAAQVPGAEVKLYQVPELVPEQALKQAGAWEARQKFADLPVIEPADLAGADAIIFGTPTRFGMMCAQMRQLLDRTGGLWAGGALIGKVGSVFTSTGTQHGGQESTILSFHTTLLAHGMIILGVPYAETRLTVMDQVTGGSPFGASTIAGGDGSRRPSENELAIARTQGKRVAEVAARLTA